jgi:hypothetical protein
MGKLGLIALGFAVVVIYLTLNTVGIDTLMMLAGR